MILIEKLKIDIVFLGLQINHNQATELFLLWSLVTWICLLNMNIKLNEYNIKIKAINYLPA